MYQQGDGDLQQIGDEKYIFAKFIYIATFLLIWTFHEELFRIKMKVWGL